MKSYSFIAFILSLVVLVDLPAGAEDMDTALSGLATNIAAAIKDHGNRKVTVLDFTDLQGNQSELGRYVAEQLTVDLVMGKHTFAVLDRANLKSILAEHKLTAKGLVDPENARKFGQLAGVDALIIGNVVPMNPDVDLTVKIITTDTAEIIGAAKTSFASTKETELLLKSSVTPSDTVGDGLSQAPPKKDFDAPKSSFDFGLLNVTLDSIRPLHDGRFAVTLLFKNTSTNTILSVAFNRNEFGDATAYLFDDQGYQYQAGRNVEGIAIRSSAGYWYSPTDSADQRQAQQQEKTEKEMAGATSIPPGTVVPTIMYFPVNGRENSAGFRLQCAFTVATKARFFGENFNEYTMMIEDVRPHPLQTQ